MEIADNDIKILGNYYKVYLMETMNKMRREIEHTQRNTNGPSRDEKYTIWNKKFTGQD